MFSKGRHDRTGQAVIGTLIGIAVATNALAPTAHAETYNVNMLAHTFSMNGAGQPTVWPTINVGDTIQWTLISGFHTTAAATGQAEFWDSPFMSVAGQTFTHTFTIPGTYWYFCTLHGTDNGDGTASGMSGTITVVPAPGAAMLLGGAGLLTARRPRRR